jgi:hypothetical protein
VLRVAGIPEVLRAGGILGSVARSEHTGSVARGVRTRNRSIEKLEFI